MSLEVEAMPTFLRETLRQVNARRFGRRSKERVARSEESCLRETLRRLRQEGGGILVISLIALNPLVYEKNISAH